MFKRSASSTTFGAILCAALLLSCALIAMPQSGRRARKSTPVPVSKPEPTPTPVTPAAKPKPAFTFVIGMDRFGDFPRISLHYLSAVLNTCSRRLDEPVTVEVVTATRDMSRSDAILRAKAEKEAHVVWLELQPETLGARSRPNDDALNVTIGYSVFAPITAKIVTSGRAYPSAYRNRGVIVSPRTGGIYGGHYQLNQAAEEAADRILEHFHLGRIRTRLNRD